ncbi:MAG TPA: hypothetical protein VGM36_12600 [Rhizomicrobium sp.]|jgi:hypothetical protein
MAKVPVGKTIAFSYSFTFGNIGAIIGQIWLPMLLLTLGGYFVVTPYYSSFSQAVAENNTALVGQAAVTLMFYSLVSLIFYAMIYVALTRAALGQTQNHSIFHFSLGVAEWRMYGAILALALALVILLIVIVLAAGLLGGIATAALGAAGMAPEMAQAAKGIAPKVVSAPVAAVGALITLFIVCAAAYVFVRLSFVLAPVTVVEEQISLGRGWQLTAKNFWRMFVILLATLGPVFVLMAICEAIVLGPDALMPHGTGSFADTAAEMEKMRPHLPVLYGLSFVVSPFLFGLMLGASAFAYRALVPPPAARGVILDAP